MSSEVIINKNTFALEGGEQGLKQTILKTCARIHANAVSGDPVDTGALKNSIMWRTSWDGDGGLNSQGGANAPSKLTVRPQGLEGIVGTNVSYAVYQEFGTRYMRAQPYMRPAADAVRGATAGEIAKKWGKDAMKEEFKQRKKRTRKL